MAFTLFQNFILKLEATINDINVKYKKDMLEFIHDSIINHYTAEMLKQITIWH
jgi:hypothetical protein